MLSVGIIVLVAAAAFAAAAPMSELLERVGAAIALVAASITAIGLLFRRALSVLRVLEALADLPESLGRIDDRLERLELADEEQQRDHAEVRTLLACVDERLARIEQYREAAHAGQQAT